MNQWSGTVINVYTDYFINDLWGLNGIDYHFAPSIHAKQELTSYGIPEHHILVTGIPVHPVFKEQTKQSGRNGKLNVLISGGNMGAGSMEKLLRSLHPTGDITYRVLCGKNKRLFQAVQQLNHQEIKGLPYMDSKEKMNHLYDEADAIITKPGGVTISECLWKKLPIFVYEALPGQEEYNLQYLKSQGLAFHLDNWASSKSIEEHILKNLHHSRSGVEAFHEGMEKGNFLEVMERMAGM